MVGNGKGAGLRSMSGGEGHQMKCEICDTQPATMWVEGRARKGIVLQQLATHSVLVEPAPQPIVSCDDCGPQAGYKILAPLEPTTTR